MSMPGAGDIYIFFESRRLPSTWAVALNEIHMIEEYCIAERMLPVPTNKILLHQLNFFL